MNNSKIKKVGQEVIKLESMALSKLSKSLGKDFVKAVDLISNQNGKITDEQLMQAIKLKGFSDNPELMQKLLKLLNAEMNKPELLNVQMKALKEMQGLEDASINLAGAVAGADEADKKQKLADKFISANNLRGMLVAKDAMSKAFALLFGKAFDTTQLNEVLGGLGEWEDYYRNMKKKKEKDELEYKAKSKSNFDNLQRNFKQTLKNKTLNKENELVLHS